MEVCYLIFKLRYQYIRVCADAQTCFAKNIGSPSESVGRLFLGHQETP